MTRATHRVENQSPPLPDHDALACDAVAAEAFARWGAPHDAPALHDLGTLAGGTTARAWGEQADRNPPVLRTHSPSGERVDEVDFHPAWHRLLDVAVSHGLTAEPWTRPAGTGAHLRRAVGFHLWSQVEAGHLCPVSMTYAAVPALGADERLRDEWAPLLAARTYDGTLRPHADKAGCLAGMGMTEKQGGSDVRRNTTVATTETGGGPFAGGAPYRLTGHKWFCSAPMSDVFLMLAQAPGGLTCFVVPRVLDDGTRNAFALQRLKDKLGNRANASSEVELDGTWALRLGDEGRGVRTILGMVAATRLDCVLGSAATMRQALVRAVHHTRHRCAFGARLADQPLMRNVLVDLALESEAATTVGLRLAAAVDEGNTALTRLAVPAAKYWVCKRGAPMVAEALECLGGNGYVEEHGLARLYREAPLNSIWEGSGSVTALDVVRALGREPEVLDALAAELAAAHGADPTLDRRAAEALADARGLAAHDPPDAQLGARRLVERLALVLQASLLVRHAPAYVSDAFVASRLGDGSGHGHTFGTLPEALVRDVGAKVLDRAWPQ